MLNWNNEVKLIISDVDDTIAEVYKDASCEMICELEKLLCEGIVFLLISGQSFDNIFNRVIKFIDKKLLNKVLVSPCNGAEVIGFDKHGSVISTPIFSVDTVYSNIDYTKIKSIISQIITEFNIETIEVMNLDEYKLATKGNPRAVMIDDRRLQISFDFINGCRINDFLSNKEINYEMSGVNDIRLLILEKAKSLFKEANIPITAKLGGTFAIDFCVEGVTKGLPISKLVVLGKKFEARLPNKIIYSNHNQIQIWGDNFSLLNSGADLDMSLALPKEVRSISFRDIDNSEIIKDYNIVVWDGKERLHNGLLEYLLSRNNS